MRTSRLLNLPASCCQQQGMRMSRLAHASSSAVSFDSALARSSGAPPPSEDLQHNVARHSREQFHQASASALSMSAAASSPLASLGNSNSLLPKLVLVQTPDTHEYELWHTNPHDPARRTTSSLKDLYPKLA